MSKTAKKTDGQFQEVPLELIVTEGQSVREAQDDDHVIELAMSISKHGLLEPIVLQSRPDGRFQLLAGFHRLCAFHRLNRDSIPSHVRTQETASVKTIALIENIIRRDMSLDEQVKAVAHLQKEDGLSTSQICELLGKSTEWVNKRLMIPNLPEDVRTELLAGTISIKHAETIGRVQDAPTRALILNQTIAAKLTTRQTDELTKLYLDTPTMESAIAEGLQKAEEIQRQKTPTRSCDYCGTITALHHIRFVAACPRCLDQINTLIENLQPGKE